MIQSKHGQEPHTRDCMCAKCKPRDRPCNCTWCQDYRACVNRAYEISNAMLKTMTPAQRNRKNVLLDMPDGSLFSLHDHYQRMGISR